MLYISWTQHIINEVVLRSAGTIRRFAKVVRRRQLEFFGHIMRNEGLENLTLTGKIRDSRGRGRPRETYMISFCRWMKDQLPDSRKEKVTIVSILHATRADFYGGP